jgi:Zn-finger nucleic acid-binding protein
LTQQIVCPICQALLQLSSEPKEDWYTCPRCLTKLGKDMLKELSRYGQYP